MSTPMTPPPDDAVAALLAELQESPLPGARYAYTVVKRRAAGWTLALRSDLEALVAAIPEDPWLEECAGGEWACYSCKLIAVHDDHCAWSKARAAIEGGR